MNWLKLNWRWSALNFFALSVLVTVLTQGSTDWNETDTFDPMLASGKWAIRFLLGCLAMSPLNTYFGWREAVKLRKSAGLWAFGFALLHLLFYIRQASLEWLTLDMPLYLIFGLSGVSILSLLALTSNRRSMQRLGKNWKRLHKLVYLAGTAVVTHGMLATMMSKRVHVRDPQAPQEIKIYIALLSVLLVVRIPFVRQLLTQIPNLLRQRRKSKLQIGSVTVPDDGVELRPQIYGRESSVSVKPTFIIPNRIPNPSEWKRSSKAAEKINENSNAPRGGQPAEIPPEVEDVIKETA